MKITTGVMIMARCKSERFSNKVVADLWGRPVIAWLMDKAKMVGPDWVIVATTKEPEDDVIENLCDSEKVECYRGPALDVFGRKKGAMEYYGLTHWIEFSGDSPFIDVRLAHLILEAFHSEPFFDQYTTGPFPSGSAGMLCGGFSKWWIDKLGKYIYSDPDFEQHQEEPGFIQGKRVLEFSMCTIDVSHLYDRRQSALNLCIDYPLQLEIANRVVEKLGFFPHDYVDIEEAYKNWNILGKGVDKK